MNQNFADKLVDQIPARVWPKLKIPLFCFSALYLLLTVAGAAVLTLHGPAGSRAALPASQEIQVHP